MRSKKQGVVLLTVLIFLQVLAILGLYGLENSLWENKMTARYWQRQVNEITAEKMLRLAERKAILNTVSCQIPVTSSRQLYHRSLGWWQSSVACAGHVGLFGYYYVVENLGVDPCAVLGVGNKAANYFRVTVLVVSKESKLGKIMLQSTVAKARRVSQLCADSHVVIEGRQGVCELFAN